ncbi:MAG: branched-chain amino acid ABC transporter permease [Candidatus Promineifilaceae bacterium]|nr:branched-chain amino acid ABC transporter permease [Candidatus Promineifilaceae bacterium]
MENLEPSWILLGTITWLLCWGTLGGIRTPSVYRAKNLNPEGTRVFGILAGMLGGPFLLLPLWYFTPEPKSKYSAILAVLLALALFRVFAYYDPNNLCVTSYNYVINQTANGLQIGFIYALMAVGLTLIYGIQGVISFAHGQYYMIGGFLSFYFLKWMSESLGITLNPLVGIVIAGIGTAVLGLIFEPLFLRPMHQGKIERPGEYAILVTFGLAFLLENTTLSIVGPFPQKAPSYLPGVGIVSLGPWMIGALELGPIRLVADRLVAAAASIVLIITLLLFLNRTWAGRALRAVSMDKQAAAVAGVNPLGMNTRAFGIGTMLAGMAGAALVPIFSWVPWIGVEAASRSFVIIVLGGLGSVPGALIGGLIIGLVEAMGTACFPDPSRGLAYKSAFGLVIFALLLLFRPTGLFGRKET